MTHDVSVQPGEDFNVEFAYTNASREGQDDLNEDLIHNTWDSFDVTTNEWASTEQSLTINNVKNMHNEVSNISTKALSAEERMIWPLSGGFTHSKAITVGVQAKFTMPQIFYK